LALDGKIEFMRISSGAGTEKEKEKPSAEKVQSKIKTLFAAHNRRRAKKNGN
jgi:hypothetical protein